MKLLFIFFCAAAILAAAAFAIFAMVKRRKNYIVSALLCALIAGIAAVGYATSQPVVKDDSPRAVHITRSPTDDAEVTNGIPERRKPVRGRSGRVYGKQQGREVSPPHLLGRRTHKR